MDVRDIKINIFSNSDELLKFLKTKQIYNYTYNFEPFQKVEESKEDNIDKKDKEDFKETVLNEINVLVIDTNLLLMEQDDIFIKGIGKTLSELAKLFEESGPWKWFYESELNDKYNFVFLYGKYQSIYNKDVDIHFKNFMTFREFFEVFYYLFNGIDYSSIDINDIIYSFGTRPYGLKCLTFNSIEEVLAFLEEFDGEINDIFYIERPDKNDFCIDCLMENVEKIQEIIDRKHQDPNLFCFTAIINNENDECWKKVFVI